MKKYKHYMAFSLSIISLLIICAAQADNDEMGVPNSEHLFDNKVIGDIGNLLSNKLKAIVISDDYSDEINIYPLSLTDT